MVLANGTVVNANENENADLWKAQKGGSGNLGFITSVDQCKQTRALEHLGPCYYWYNMDAKELLLLAAIFL